MAKVIECKNKRLADCCQRCGHRDSKLGGKDFIKCEPPGVIMPGNGICDSFVPPVRTCRKCRCTENDCSQCIEASGKPCHWVETDLCSRRKDEMDDKTAGPIEYPQIDEFKIQGPGAAR